MVNGEDVFHALCMFMSGGDCPRPGVIGECAAADQTRDHGDGDVRWEAYLYLWDKDFNDSAAVAEVVRKAGGRRVWVKSVLFSDCNGDRDGCAPEGVRPWIVSWDEKKIATGAPLRSVTQIIVGTADELEGAF